jgi:predicted mannosyl-3-phosphoglycerate phosphatase (HAD superfamily)
MKDAKARRGRSTPFSNAMRPVVFTSLEGTLLDEDTFEARSSRSILRRLAAAAIPVVPVTEMTLSEVEPIAREHGMRHAMIIEAGGAIARWTDSSWEIEPRGPEGDVLLDAIAAVEARSGADLTVYSVLPDHDATRLSGKSGAMLDGSRERGYSEPFVIERGNVTKVAKAASSLGFTLRRGRRFFHLCRADALRSAFSCLCDELRCDLAIAVGGLPLDAEFLSRADISIIVPRADGTPDPELLARMPHARIAPAPGSRGWAKAIEEACEKRMRNARPSLRAASEVRA